jgi:hypothetical protein
MVFSRFAEAPCKGQAKPKDGCKGRGMSLACRLTQGGKDMSSSKTPTLEEFRVRAAQTGLTLTPEDIEHLHKGYVGLLSLMERIPRNWAWAAEPPLVFRADE